MSFLRRYQLAGYILGITALAAFLWASSRPGQDSQEGQCHNSAFGSAEEAFDMSGRAVKECLQDCLGDPVCINSEFRATMLSRSKIWTVKGHASRPRDNQSYRWIVILNYNDMQEWEILARIVTLDLTASGKGDPDGSPNLEGKLFRSDKDG